MASKGCVCVTGADSFLGSHLVKQLLNENYKVKGTLEFSESKNHLMKLPHASENLKLCENEDLCNQSFCENAFDGCDGVFHTASPLHTGNITNADKEVINPAKETTLCILRACQAKGVKKVILTSSITAAIYHEGAPAHEMFSEDDWSDVEFLKKNCKWYHLSKTVAERTAWEFADKCSFQLISILPSMMFGPMLWPHDNFTAHILTSYINGERTEISRKSTFFVDVRDVAKAHIVAFENKSAVGRIIVNSDYFSWEAICKFIMTLKPGLKLPTSVGKGEGDLVDAKRYQMSSDREQTFLNLKFRKLDDTMNDTLKSLADFGFVESRTLTQQS